jgi:putative Holliday junction resolvase
MATTTLTNRPNLPALGVDFGERRIGLAITDDGGRIAVPLATIERETDRRAIYRLAAIAARDNIASLVVGAPRLLDGRPAENAERVRRFGERLARVCKLPLFWVEETLTTREADSRLSAQGRRPRQGDPRRDMVAAQIILEDALAGGGWPDVANRPGNTP